MQMDFPEPFSLGKGEHFDARIASRVLSCAIDRFNWSAIAHDKELEFLDGLSENALDGAR
jgi:hypothetical protein